ncbi:MAG: hypothetical protein OEU86_08750, partial [Gammaproteobacteria bacterium]|nr:hypothetical protein [Gammaproteobacteria bacterium]
MLESLFDRLATVHPLLPALAGNALLVLIALLVYAATKRILLFLVHYFAQRSKATWDDALVEHNVFGRPAQLVPALVVQQGIRLVPAWPEAAELLIM